MRPPSSVTISTLTMSVPILISLFCILHCSMLGRSGGGLGSLVGCIRRFVAIDHPRCPVSPFVSRRASSSHSSTVTVSLFCGNYHRCSCSRVQHPGVFLTFGDAFQRCSQQPLTFPKSYGECLDHFLNSSEMIECGGPE
jgi:hypothetical protein